jgi:hypothetical protein
MLCPNVCPTSIYIIFAGGQSTQNFTAIILAFFLDLGSSLFYHLSSISIGA